MAGHYKFILVGEHKYMTLSYCKSMALYEHKLIVLRKCKYKMHISYKCIVINSLVVAPAFS